MKIDHSSLPPSQTFLIKPGIPDIGLALRIGERIEGHLIEWFDEHHGLFQFQGRELQVESHFPLPFGMKGLFEVVSNFPQIVLRLLPEGEKGYPLTGKPLVPCLPGHPIIDDLGKILLDQWAAAKQFLSPSIQASIDHLLSRLEACSHAPHSSQSPDLLAKILLCSGLFFEGRMGRLIENRREGRAEEVVTGDMKGLLIKLKTHLESGFLSEGPSTKAGALRDLEESVKGLLQKIEGYQILNLRSQDAPERHYLLIPIWFQNGLHFAEMSLFLPRRDAGLREADGASLLFFLHLTELGEMSIAVKIRERRLYCRFAVSDPQASLLLNAALPELKERLEDLGFQPDLSLSVEPVESIDQEWIGEIGGDLASLFNIVI